MIRNVIGNACYDPILNSCNYSRSSRLLDENLVAEMCDGILKEDDDDLLDDDDDDDDSDTAELGSKSKGGAHQPKHILTKKKLIAIGGKAGTGVSKEKRGEPQNGGSINNKAESGHGDTA